MKSNNYYKKLLESDSELREAMEDAQLSIDISMQIYSLRHDRGLTQKDLAELAKIKQSNVSRLESPGYQGYTLKVLSKVVRALGAKLRIQIVKTITTTSRHDFLSFNRHSSSVVVSNVTSESSEVWKIEPSKINEIIKSRGKLNV